MWYLETNYSDWKSEDAVELHFQGAFEAREPRKEEIMDPVTLLVGAGVIAGGAALVRKITGGNNKPKQSCTVCGSANHTAEQMSQERANCSTCRSNRSKGSSYSGVSMDTGMGRGGGSGCGCSH